MSRRVVFTGGHHSSGLVVAQAFRKQGWEVFWLGHRHSMKKDESETAEYQEVTRANLPFYELKTSKSVHLLHPIQSIRFVYGQLQAFFLLTKIKPQLVFSWGGYLAFPVALAAWVKRIPIVTHEQTLIPGSANRLIGRLAKKVFVTWPETKKYFPAQKVVVSGLPLRPELETAKPARPFPQDKPVVYISGGKQGSHRLNQVVEEVLPELLAKFNVIHQTGSHSLYRDFERLQAKVEKYSFELRSSYRAKKYFFKEEVGSIFKRANLAVGRAGAHFTYELAWLGLPAVLVPLPISAKGEQQAQANLLAEIGLVRVIDQPKLTGATLIAELDKLWRDQPGLSAARTKARRMVNPEAVLTILAEVKSLWRA